MFGPIATLPALLPAMFQLTGQSIPKGFAEQIAPVMDILELLSASNCLEIPTVAPQNVAAAQVVRPPELTVPATEAWLVRGASVVAATGAAELLRLNLHYGRTSSGGDIPTRLFPEGRSSMTDAAAAAFVASASEGVFLLFASDYIGANVTRITTAGTIALSFRAQIFRFTV